MRTAAALLLLGLLGCTWACTSDDQCGTDECCLRQDLLIASKKRQLDGLVAPIDGVYPINYAGHCIARADVGQTCYSFNSCGCKTGLKCQYLDQALLQQPLVKRMVLYMPGHCVVDPAV